ncbi:CoA transferase subunit A [Falsiphaeobacter marinintestinus]|uniref:CoA transferase subunit A n=1 Tax=Falsiphaeobacter marinintestinus TaxID=1492905 RepID=UPI0011B7C7FF|nr:CoA-transferase [Phaeobacter marinintestinus]
MSDLFLPSIPDLAARVSSGASLMLTKGEGPDTPMELVKQIIRNNVRDLHLITLPTCANPVSGMMADMLIGAGCVASVETAGISLGEAGAAPRFNTAVKDGTITVKDGTCPAIYAAVQAGGKAQPFAPLRGLIGSDIEAMRDDYKVIDNPFNPGEPVAVLKAINPDIAAFHAPCADRNGNVWIGRQRDSLYAAHASDTVLVTVEQVMDCDFYDDPAMVAGVIPSFYITAIAEAPAGAMPMNADGKPDMDQVRAYASAARSAEGFAAWMDANVHGTLKAAE